MLNLKKEQLILLKNHIETGEFHKEISKQKNFIDKNLSSLTKYILEITQTSMTANGVGFTKTKKGFVPELVEGYYELRKKTKKEMLKLEQEYTDTKNEKLVPQISSLNAKQMAIKIL